MSHYRSGRNVCLGCLGALSCLIGTSASGQAPEIGGLLPAGGPRGSVTRVQIDGKNLKGSTLFLDGAGLKAKSIAIAPAGDLVTADVLVEPGAPLGPHDVRIITPRGISNGARFWVDTRPNRVIDRPMTATTAPEPIDGALPVVINSRIAAKTATDRYVLTASAGEIWTFQCMADQIRSRLDPVLELKDEAGVSLRLAQGAWESDPSFSYRFATAGRYFLTVRDSEYSGGANFTYRLIAGRSPLVTGFTPRGGRPGQQVDLSLQGVNLPTDRASVIIPSDASGVYWASVISGAGSSILLPLIVDLIAVQDEGDGGTVRPIPPLPALIDGWFGHSPLARFSLHASAGGRFTFDLLGRRIGSRIDGALRVLDSTGKELAANDDAPGLGKDALLEFTAPATGDYQLEVRNVEEITGPDCYYRLRALPVVPDFRVTIATDRLATPIGGTVTVLVTVERTGGFNGSVELKCGATPPGVTFRGGTIAPGKTEIEATLTAAPDAAVGSAIVRITGECEIGGRRVVREAPAWERYEHRSIDLLLSVEYSYTRPHHIWDALLLAVTERTDPITVSATVSDLRLRAGSSVEIPIHVLRHPGATGEIKLDVRGLPSRVTPAAVTIPAGQSDAKIVLSAPADSAPDSAYIIVQAHLGGSVCLLPLLHLTLSK